ncbi:hypothetical protein U9M48_000954 [Paspalum notatum var. saurae]|uniref:AAA+ ATPase domain-containing protein n=1 Tax=Paspalum notatum var. saurae TaxID=547442 RepID=A0AAQ3SCN3_PASNO
MGWLLSPITTLLVNKLFAYLLSDISRKYRRLETTTVSDLERTLNTVQEQRMQRTVEDKGPRCDLERLAKTEEHLKSAWYEAQDIMDTVEYRRTEEESIGRTSSWVRRRLDAAGACIAGCFWLGRQIDVARAATLQCAQRFYQVAAGRFIIIHGLLQHAQISFFCQRQFRGAAATTPGPLLPISESGTSMVGTGTTISSSIALEAIGLGDAPSQLGGPKPPLLRPTEEVAEEKVEEIEEEENDREEEKKEEEQEKVKEEIQEEKQHDKEEEKKESVRKEEQDKVREDENGALYRCIRSMLICLSNAIVFARSYRDWSYQEVFGIESNQQRGKIADYSFFPPFGANSLSKRIQHIENILDDSKKSNLLNQQSGSSKIPVSKESSSSEISINDTKKESSSRREQIDNLDRKIERKVFGRDIELKRICEMFRKRPYGHGSKPYSVLGIHGIAGSGKSTLANYVCDHEKKAGEKYFDLIMFSKVSVNFRVDKIFRDMLREISKDQQSDSKDIEFLRNELMGKLEGKRFLLVLDDLWVNDGNQKERDILLDALLAGQNGSIILVTAQRDDAAAGLGAEEQIPIPDLEEEEYIKLFMHHALQGAVYDKGEFERIGKIIVEKLHRSPIAAVTVAKRLGMNRSIRFWERTANLDVLSRTMGALWWSYQQLDVDIRRCFVYCSTFPAGYKLKRDELVRIWIAHGFLNTTGNKTEEMEDAGDRYLDELVKSSFLQVRNTWGIGEEITIHDLLHELAERVAGSDFFRIDDSSVLPEKDLPRGVRHLFIGSKNAAQDAETAGEKNLDLGNLRTLIIDETYNNSTNGEQRRHDFEKIFDRLFRKLMKLQVLIIKLVNNDTDELSFPVSIDQMKHLRYISFRCHWWDYEGKLILPSTFSKLYQMQTLCFFLRGGTVSYPDGMANLIRLRHGDLGGVPNIGRMTSLQTMPYFSVKKEQGHELKQLEQLNKLRGSLMIFGLESVGSKDEALEADLASKNRVTDLLLDFDSSTKNHPDVEAEVLEGLYPPKDLQELTIQGYRGSRYPSWMLSGQQHPDAPKHLRRLHLIHCSCPLTSFPEDSELFMNLHELLIRSWEHDSLPENMERLVSLQSLFIVGCDNSKSTMVLGPTLPRSLRKIWIFESILVLENMEHLVSLESLDIHRCFEMEILPTLPLSLKKISISWCDVLRRTCQEEGHENWQKIKHVPSKDIM